MMLTNTDKAVIALTAKYEELEKMVEELIKRLEDDMRTQDMRLDWLEEVE